MKKNLIKVDDMEFLKFTDGRINILFSTAENNVSYKINTDEGKSNLKKLKEVFDVESVKYINQIHSSIIFDLNEEHEVVGKEGDGLVSTYENEIIGVFTADCVPVILYDERKNIISAVHSGWKGTIGDISKKATEIMKSRYGAEEIKVIIGPHIGECCYEVSEDLANKFSDKYGKHVSKGRMLSLENAIKKQLEGIVKRDNIKSLGICTNCNSEYKMHSYRRKLDEAGRLFSFVYIK